MDLRRATTISFLSRAGTVIATFLIFTASARQMGSSLFGSFVLFLAILNVVGLFTDLGIDGAIEKRISGEGGPNVLGSALLVKSGALLLASSILLSFRAGLNEYVGASVTAWLVIVLSTQQLSRVFVMSLRGELRVGEAEFILFSGKAVFAIIGLLAIQFYPSVRSLIASYWIGWLIVLGWAAVRQSTSVGTFKGAALRSIYEYARYNFVAAVVSKRIYGWVDVLIIGLFLSSSAVASYELAWRVAGTVMLLPQAIGMTIFPQISEWSARGALEKVEDILPTAYFAALSLIIPATGGIFVLSRQVMSIVFGPEFAIASGALMVLTIGKIPQALNGISGRTISGLDKPRYGAIASLVLVFSNVVFNLALVPALSGISPYFGLVGAAIATASSILLALFVTLYYLTSFISVQFPIRNIGISCLSTVSMILVVSWVTTKIRVDDSLVLLVVITLGATIYGIGIVGSKTVRQQIKAALSAH